MRKLHNWIQAYIQYTSALEAPERFHYWTAVSCIAGALRRKVWLPMGHFEWTPNFFVFFVSPPGIVSKSTTAGVGMSLLKKVPGIKFGPASSTWQALVKALSESREDFPLPGGEFLPMSCMTIMASELGTFLDPQNREMIDVLVDLWDGRADTWTKTTLKDGEQAIINPWINFIACTTPTWVADNFNEHFIGGGFASRSIFLYGREKRHLVAYPFTRMDASTVQLGADLIADLQDMAALRGPYTLTKDALQWGEWWYGEHYRSIPKGLTSDRFQGYLARKQTHMHKLGMVLSAANRGDMQLTMADLTEANEALNGLEGDLPQVFESVGGDAMTSHTHEIYAKIKDSGGMGKQDLFRKFYRIISFEDFEKSIASLNAAGLIQQIQHGTTLRIEPLIPHQVRA